MQICKLNIRKIPFFEYGFLNFLNGFKIHQLTILQIKFYKAFQFIRNKLGFGCYCTLHRNICRQSASDILVSWRFQSEIIKGIKNFTHVNVFQLGFE